MSRSTTSAALVERGVGVLSAVVFANELVLMLESHGYGIECDEAGCPSCCGARLLLSPEAHMCLR